MAQDYVDALDDAGYDVIDAFEQVVVLNLSEVGIHDEEFDEVDLTVVAGSDGSDGLSFGVVDVYRDDNELTDAHEAVLEDVGRRDDGGAVFEVDAEELDDFDEIAGPIREIHSDC